MGRSCVDETPVRPLTSSARRPVACISLSVVLAAAFVVASFLAAGLASVLRTLPRSLGIVERGIDDLHVRLEGRVAGGIGLDAPKGDYRLLVRSGRGEWTHALTVRVPYPDPLAEDSVVLVDREHLLVFAGHRLARSHDGGKTWSLWSVPDRPSSLGAGWLIESVRVERTGTGEMRARNRGDSGSAERSFITTDYGRTWNE